jgi:hypothetical protein
LLDRAIRRAGGGRALARARVLRWQGDAALHVGGRDLALGVSTVVVPFEWARSTSWIQADGPGKARTMVITPTGGWSERGGAAQALPEAIVAHERAQFAAYGLMLLAPLARGGARIEAAPAQGGLAALRVAHPRAPAATLLFEAGGRLAELHDEVPDPEGGPPVPQRFLFSRETMPGPVRWPRRITLLQRGAPYFQLTLSRFEAATA